MSVFPPVTLIRSRSCFRNGFWRYHIRDPPPHRPPQPHAAAPSEQQRGSQPECGGRGEGHRTEGGIERVNKPEQINIISPTLAPQTEGPRTESDKLPDGRPSSWWAAERRRRVARSTHGGVGGKGSFCANSAEAEEAGDESISLFPSSDDRERRAKTGDRVCRVRTAAFGRAGEGTS